MFQEIQSKLRCALVFVLFVSALSTPWSQAQQKKETKTGSHENKPAGTAHGTSAAAIARGERIFKQARCVGCHAGGDNSLMPDHPIKGKSFAARYRQDSTLERAIRKGFPESGMAGFDQSEISDSQMKDLILYIKSFTPKGE